MRGGDRRGQARQRRAWRARKLRSPWVGVSRPGGAGLSGKELDPRGRGWLETHSFCARKLEWVAMMILCRRMHHEPVTGPDPIATHVAACRCWMDTSVRVSAGALGDGPAAQPPAHGDVAGCPAPRRWNEYTHVQPVCSAPRVSRTIVFSVCMQLSYCCCALGNGSGCSSINQFFSSWFGREFKGLCKLTVNFRGFALILVLSAFESVVMSNCCWIGLLLCPCSFFSVPFGGIRLYRWSDRCFSQVI